MSDTLSDRFAPALNATSDMPATEAAPAAAPEPAPAVAAESSAPNPDAPAPVATEATEAPREAKEPQGVGKALAERDAALTAANAAREAADARAAAAIKAVEELTARLPVPTAPEEPVDARPARDAFDSPEAYDSALVEWAGRAAAKTAKAQLEAEQKTQREAAEKADLERRQNEQNQALLSQWNERKAKVVEEFPDFDAVAGSDDLAIAPPMAAAIMDADNGPQIAYHLGKNPTEAARIAALPPGRQVMEIGRISAQLSIPKPRVSRTPDPIEPIVPAGPSTQSIEDESMEAYAARRNAELNASRRKPGQPSIH